MVPGARPGIVLGPLDKSRPDGIILNKADLLKNASVVQHARKEPPPPEVAGNAFLVVEVLGISHVEGVEGEGEPSLSFRDANKVDMVPHQAVGPDIDRVAGGAFVQPSKVAPEIGILFEDGLSVVPPLGDLVRVTDDGGAGETGHWISYRRWAPRGAGATMTRPVMSRGDSSGEARRSRGRSMRLERGKRPTRTFFNGDGQLH